MPFTVSCPACGSRFTLGDDLYRRKVAGNLVMVKCRHCSAEIAVDATEPATMPSHEVPRRAPAPPRPKDKLLARTTLVGVSPPPPVHVSAPLADVSAPPADVSAPPADVSAPPLEAEAAPAEQSASSPEAGEWSATWDTDLTLARAVPGAPVSAPAQLEFELELELDPDPEPELIEVEEIPASSSDAPTLAALQAEAGGVKPAPSKQTPDDFLIQLSASGEPLTGAPTIDVSGLGDVTFPDSDPIQENEIESTPPIRPARSATIPLFDMSAVLPHVSPAARLEPSEASVQRDSSSGLSEAPVSLASVRSRKFVVAPEDDAGDWELPKSRTGVLWFTLFAAAAGVAVVFAFRSQRAAQPAQTSELDPTLSRAIPAQVAALPAPEAQPSEALPSDAQGAPAASSSAQPAVARATTTPAASPPPPAKRAPLSSNASKASSARAVAPSSTPSSESDSPVASDSSEADGAPAEPAPEFDAETARSALASVMGQASLCRKEGDPSGTANVTVTFAPSGRVTSATVQGAPFAGTATGGCIASAMRRASVPAFSGEYVTVSKTVVIQ